MSDNTLSLNDASKLTGVSAVTLRRRIKEGRLEAEPRKSAKAEIRLTTQGLIKAGFVIQDEIMSTSTALLADREAQIVALKAELEKERAEKVAVLGDLRALTGKLEGVTESYQLALEAFKPVQELLTKNAQRLIIDEPVRSRLNWLKRRK